jgi:hypothetical protein
MAALNKLQLQVFGRVLNNESTIILKGVASTINTETLFASYFNFSDSDISNFIVDVGLNTVTAIIGVTDIIVNTNGFINNSQLTSFYFQGKSLDTGIQGFRNCANLANFDCDGDVYLNGSSFLQCAKLRVNWIVFTKKVFINYFTQCFNLIMNAGGTLNLSGVDSIITDSQVHLAFGARTYTINLNNCHTLNINNTDGYTTLFSNFNGTINLANLTTMGVPSVNKNVFGTHTTTMTVNVNAVMATINGGLPHAELQSVVARGGTVNYI